MGATLNAVRGPRFSETARSRPGHREARRHRRSGAGAAVLARCDADDRAERAAERAEAGEADVEADPGDRVVRRAQQEHGPLDAAALQVAVRRLAERPAERADEVRLADVGDPRERGDVERLRVRAVHRVAGAKEAAVLLLGGAAHRPSSCRWTSTGCRWSASSPSATRWPRSCARAATARAP